MEWVDSALDILELDVPVEDVVLIEEDYNYPGNLSFQTLNQSRLLGRYSDYLSRFGFLFDRRLFLDLVAAMKGDGYTVVALSSSRELVEKASSYNLEYVVDGLRDPHSPQNPCTLSPHQKYALQVSQGKSSFVFNHSTGSGKSVLMAAGVQDIMANKEQADVALVFTLKSLRVNMQRTIQKSTSVSEVVVPDGDKERRRKAYSNPDNKVFILNYDKANFDFEELLEVVRGKRVLFLMDEVQKVIMTSVKTRARKGIDLLIKASKKHTVWKLSASLTDGDPERYYRAFSLGESRNPLGILGAFRRRYVMSESIDQFGNTQRQWNARLLEDIQFRVVDHTHVVRQTDPGVRELYRDTQFQELDVVMSRQDREVYETISQNAFKALRSAHEDGGLTKSQKAMFVQAKQLVCVTPEALLRSKLMDCAEGVNPKLLTSKNCEKMKMLIDRLRDIREDNDKAVVFSHWNRMGAQIISEYLKEAKIEHVLHHGQMSSKEGQLAQDHFKATPKCTVFLSTDAGAHGLNFQEARYVINYDIPRSWDLLQQRNARIDRVDSKLDNLTSVAMKYEATIEEQIWQENNRRREMSAIIQGTSEELERYSGSSLSLDQLLFGDSE